MFVGIPEHSLSSWLKYKLKPGHSYKGVFQLGWGKGVPDFVFFWGEQWKIEWKHFQLLILSKVITRKPTISNYSLSFLQRKGIFNPKRKETISQNKGYCFYWLNRLNFWFLSFSKNFSKSHCKVHSEPGQLRQFQAVPDFNFLASENLPTSGPSPLWVS